MEPAVATQHSAAGAKAFAEFFIKTIDWGFATTSGAYVRHYASPSCKSCATFADGMDRARAANHSYVGGRMTIKTVSLASHPLAHGATYTGLVTFDITSFEEVDKNGHGVSADPAHSGEQFEVSIAWFSGQWRTIDLAVNQ